MQEKYIRLLKVMLESNGEVLNSQELSEQIGISQRTVLRYIKEIKAEGDEKVFRVDTWKGRGYYLNVLDRAKFRELLNEIREIHGEQVIIQLIIAAPNPISFEIGKCIMKNIDPTIFSSLSPRTGSQYPFISTSLIEFSSLYTYRKLNSHPQS